MNTASIKYNKIIGKDGMFSGSMTGVQDDIVAMFASKPRKERPLVLSITPMKKRNIVMTVATYPNF